MPLIVETGTGSASADSYASLAQADAYHAAFGGSAWTGSDALKESALRRATRYLDGRYRARYSGTKCTRTQALEWPRFAAEESGWAVDTNAVPKAVQNATIEAALRELVSPGSSSPDVSNGAVLSETVTAGPVSTSTTYANNGRSGPDASAPVFLVLDQLLGGLIRGSNSAKLVRG